VLDFSCKLSLQRQLQVAAVVNCGIWALTMVNHGTTVNVY